MSSDFGPRAIDPVTRKVLVDGHHDGYDLAAAAGTPIRASKTGTVVFVGPRGGYGNAVILSHDSEWSTLYGHASRLVVKLGQRVRAGDVIGYVGSTGHSTGPHLHYELRQNGKPVDPLLAGVRARVSSGAHAVAPKKKTLAHPGKTRVPRLARKGALRPGKVS